MRTTAIALNRAAHIAPVANQLALSYRNERVVARLAEEGKMSIEDAGVLFKDTLKFLALTGSSLKLSPSAPIDLGWHNFILHTRDYAGFCERCFGSFIHHEPGSALTHDGPVMDVAETAEYARSVYGEISPNWTASRGRTCGSSGC